MSTPLVPATQTKQPPNHLPTCLNPSHLTSLSTGSLIENILIDLRPILRYLKSRGGLGRVALRGRVGTLVVECLYWRTRLLRLWKWRILRDEVLGPEDWLLGIQSPWRVWDGADILVWCLALAFVSFEIYLLVIEERTEFINWVMTWNSCLIRLRVIIFLNSKALILQFDNLKIRKGILFYIQFRPILSTLSYRLFRGTWLFINLVAKAHPAIRHHMSPLLLRLVTLDLQHPYPLTPRPISQQTRENMCRFRACHLIGFNWSFSCRLLRFEHARRNFISWIVGFS